MSLQTCWEVQRELSKPDTSRSVLPPSNAPAKETGSAHGRPRSVSGKTALTSVVRWSRAVGHSAGKDTGMDINAHKLNSAHQNENVNALTNVIAGCVFDSRPRQERAGSIGQQWCSKWFADNIPYLLGNLPPADKQASSDE